MPRVLHIVYNLIRGGTEGQCARLALEMVGRGQTHRLAVFRREGFFLGKVESACGPVHEIGIRRMVSWDTLRRVLRLGAFVRRQAIDLVHAWDADAAIFGSLAALWGRVPYITSRRDLGEIYPPYKLRLMRWADLGARAVVVNAEAIRRRLESDRPGALRIRKIPNLMDIEEFDRLSSQSFPLRTLLPAGRLIGVINRLDPEKDVETFLRAAQAISARHPDVGFVIAGDGAERRRLEAVAREAGLLPARIAFLGEVQEVPALIRHLSVGVLVPRANEGLSNSILEYMAGRLPVVATRCGGNEEMVQTGQTGFLVEPGDVAGLVEAVGFLLDQPALAEEFGRRGRERVERHHGPGMVARQFAALYEEASGASPTARCTGFVASTPPRRNSGGPSGGSRRRRRRREAVS